MFLSTYATERCAELKVYLIAYVLSLQNLLLVLLEAVRSLNIRRDGDNL